MSKTRIYKDALTGRFVRPDVAKASPRTTYSINGSFTQTAYRDTTTGRFVPMVPNQPSPYTLATLVH